MFLLLETQHVLSTAKAKLKTLESSHGLKKDNIKKDSESELQLSFFNLDDPLLESIREEIAALDIDTLTPVEALMQLNQIKRRISQKGQG